VNTQALNSLADLICRAQEQDRTPMGIAFRIDAAGRHMSPEVAAELAALRVEVAALRDERHSTNEALSDAAERMRADRDRFETLRALCDAAEHVGIVSGGWFTVEAVRRAAAGAPLPKPDAITKAFAPTQVLREDHRPSAEWVAETFSPKSSGSLEDPHDSPLHRDWRIPHDLPELGGQR